MKTLKEVAKKSCQVRKEIDEMVARGELRSSLSGVEYVKRMGSMVYWAGNIIDFNSLLDAVDRGELGFKPAVRAIGKKGTFFNLSNEDVAIASLEK